MTRARDLADTQDNLGGAVPPFVAGKNKILNGDFRINQRNFTSNTTSGEYNFDRYRSEQVGGTVTFTPQTFTPGAAPVAGYEGTTFLRCVTSGQSGTNYSQVSQRIEDVRTLAGQTATFSFWAKATSGTPSVGIVIVQRFGSGGSSAVVVTSTSATISTSWARYSATVSVPSISGKTIGTGSNLEVTILYSDGSSVGIQNNTIDLWGWQLEAGSVATAFQTATGTLQGELAACQRYYQRWTGSSANYLVNGYGPAYSTTAIAASLFNVQPMRVKPTAVDYSSLKVEDNVNASVAITGLSITTSSSSQQVTLLATGASGLTQYRFYQIIANGSGDYLGISAEL